MDTVKIIIAVILIGSFGYAQNNIKWFYPSKKICVKNGGSSEEITNYVCNAKPLDAAKICEESGGRLPTFEELQRIAEDCGIKPKTSKANSFTNRERAIMNNSSYQRCYHSKGFRFTDSEDSYIRGASYLSSTKCNKHLKDGCYLVMEFKWGTIYYGDRLSTYTFRCVRK